jgi:hypothetical protein
VRGQSRCEDSTTHHELDILALAPPQVGFWIIFQYERPSRQSVDGALMPGGSYSGGGDGASKV